MSKNHKNYEIACLTIALIAGAIIIGSILMITERARQSNAQKDPQAYCISFNEKNEVIINGKTYVHIEDAVAALHFERMPSCNRETAHKP